MKTIMKNSLCFLIGLFILFSFNCYAGETLTAQQKEAEVWYEKANSVDTLALKIEYYTKAIELDPEFVNAYNNRGYAYINLGEYQKAIDDCSKAVEIDPKLASAYNNRGVAYINLGKYQKAIDDCSKAIEIDPKLANAYNSRGNVYVVGLGKYQKAIDDYSKAIELNPSFASAYFSRGTAYTFQKSPTAAGGDFYQAGILFLKQNNTSQALICVDWMKKINPSSPLINKLMDQINK